MSMNEKENVLVFTMLFLIGLFFYFCFHIDPDASLISKLILFPLGMGILWGIYGYLGYAFSVFIFLMIKSKYGKEYHFELMIITLVLSLWAAKTTFVYFFL
ncbi:hypothetical protein QV08_11890 [Gallibacterium salpingitidis]|uniref:Uncharacterized protein n=1 Tax=Gallibacterium salpingitidis TaxID=505341 RepID=A0AB36E219_9PAST|nr:hypothetical protein [Gallibacterium salpingitidis]OBX05324.1 hypothetical protein QV08_11890 [Gallibacterium salpingitidis]OBX10036.1 hypothetical protein QV09_07005 [Gallibacterium salpingitidis]WKT00591.1 hypothetical protein NYR30_04755 [Gallibacterium salpingitidis]